MNRRRAWILFLVLASVAVRLQSAPVWIGAPDEPVPPRWQSLASPFGDDLRGSCNAFLSLLARSLLREGLAATGGIPLMNVTDVEPEQFWYYDHHTPGVPLVTAVAMTVLGDSEGTSRLVALLFATLTTLILLAFTARHLGVPGLLAVFGAQVFLPMGLFYSLHLNFEVPTLPFLLGFLVLALQDQPTRRQRFLAATALAAAFFMDVVALFGPAAVALVEWRRRGWRTAAGWLLFGGGLAVLWLLWKTGQLARHGHTEAGSLLAHLTSSTVLSPAFDAGRWLRQVTGYLLVLGGGWPVTLLLFEILVELWRPTPGCVARLFRASLVVAVLNVVLPVIQATEHDYYVLYFQIPLALACGRFALRLVRIGESLGVTPRVAAMPAVLVLAPALIATGCWSELPRPVPRTDVPSHHRLGREISAAVDVSGTVVALESPDPSGMSWHLITLAYYAGRPVLPLDDPAAVPALRQGLLRLQGLGDAPIVLARDRRWPGRGGYTPLAE